jgi:hypothetical protein
MLVPFWDLTGRFVGDWSARQEPLAHVALVRAGYGSQFRGSERSGRESLVKSKTVSDHDHTGVNGGSRNGDELSYELLQLFRIHSRGFLQIDLKSQGFTSCSGRPRD